MRGARSLHDAVELAICPVEEGRGCGEVRLAWPASWRRLAALGRLGPAVRVFGRVARLPMSVAGLLFLRASTAARSMR